jgi:deoxyribose-phosphate aldolase
VSATAGTFRLCTVCTEHGCCAVICEDRVRTLRDAGAARVSAVPGIGPVRGDLARLIDHTLLRADASADEVRTLCAEARRYGFATVCVNPTWVALCAQELHDTAVGVCSVVGFPFGTHRSPVKAFETARVVSLGASEVDMVIPIGALRSGDDRDVLEDIRSVVEAAGRRAAVKVILETAYLNDSEKSRGARLAKEAGAAFVKTSTGFGPSGATADDVRLLREAVGPAMGVKAAGGIRDTEAALKMVAAGADRIGASASVKIVGGDETRANPKARPG